MDGFGTQSEIGEAYDKLTDTLETLRGYETRVNHNYELELGTQDGLVSAYKNAYNEGRSSLESGGASSSGYDPSRRDRPERSRALYAGEMVNQFRDKVKNWNDYYREIAKPEYKPDYFEDGERITILLNGQKLTLQMREYGEFEVIDVEDIAYD